MKRLVLLIITLGAAIWIGLKIKAGPGYVLVAYKQWSLETTLWFAVLSLVIVFIGLYMLIRSFKAAVNSHRRFKQWWSKKRRRRARRWTNRGLRLLAEGQWIAAEKYLIGRAKDSELPFINYLAAARAVQAQGRFKTRDHYLRQADFTQTSSQLAVALSQAQLQMEAGQYEEAAATLSHLYHENPEHLYVLNLLKTAYKALEDWQRLYDLLPQLARKGVMQEGEYAQLEREVYWRLLQQSSHCRDQVQFDELWSAIPKGLKYEPDIAELYVDHIYQHGHTLQALQFIQDVVKRQWSPGLVTRYGLILGHDLAKQLAIAEHWLKAYGNRHELLMTLGHLARQQQHWDKAQYYLELALQVRETMAAYYGLGHLYEDLDDHDKAYYFYRAGLNMGVREQTVIEIN